MTDQNAKPANPEKWPSHRGESECGSCKDLRTKLAKAEEEREGFHKTCGELLQATIEGDGSVTWSRVECEDCAKLRTRLAEVEGERNTVVCEDTGRMARGGECPEHHGDACLYDVSAMREAVNQNTSLRVQLREALKQESRGCPCTLTKPCMDVCSCANMVHSGGCLRCCRYGSEEQRKARAEIIADAEERVTAVVGAARLLNGCKEKGKCAACLARLNDAVYALKE